ncbi:hypothetical protein DID88_003091 [Monilinia fructigena]|uniref:Uncharacterized protein n=1 Tax=Monilinia fructigena TaxID=38457 RepID=A0A395IWW0_9HELO|nr:hypothetical protein DID88_003091 [Monilinia fructigena]
MVVAMLKRRNPEASGTNRRMKTEPQSEYFLDSGSSVPVLSSDKAEQWKIDTYTRPVARTITAFDASPVIGGGERFTPELAIQHDKHFSQVAFELSRLDDSCDAILPQWWLEEHPPNNFFDAAEAITFTHRSNACGAVPN